MSVNKHAQSAGAISSHQILSPCSVTFWKAPGLLHGWDRTCPGPQSSRSELGWWGGCGGSGGQARLPMTRMGSAGSSGCRVHPSWPDSQRQHPEVHPNLCFPSHSPGTGSSARPSGQPHEPLSPPQLTSAPGKLNTG